MHQACNYDFYVTCKFKGQTYQSMWGDFSEQRESFQSKCKSHRCAKMHQDGLDKPL